MFLNGKHLIVENWKEKSVCSNWERNCITINGTTTLVIQWAGNFNLIYTNQIGVRQLTILVI